MIIEHTDYNVQTGETTVYNIEIPDKTLQELKKQKLSEIKQTFLNASVKPIVDTGLGFSVDGGYANKTDFETGKKYSFPQVRGSDNLMHAVTLADYDTIISAIEINGIGLYQKKWALEEAINASSTIDELGAITW